MDFIKPIKLGIAKKLRNKKYRAAFFRERAQDEVAFQIRGMRDKRELRQKALAELCGMKQSAISRIERSDYSAWNFTTLLRVADALDAKLKVTFVPAEEVIAEYDFLENPAAGEQAGVYAVHSDRVGISNVNVYNARPAKIELAKGVSVPLYDIPIASQRAIEPSFITQPKSQSVGVPNG